MEIINLLNVQECESVGDTFGSGDTIKIGQFREKVKSNHIIISVIRY